MKKIKLPFSVLVYDIETALLKFRGFQLGEQVVRYTQLDPAFDEFKIICITAKWLGSPEIFTFRGDKAVTLFDTLARKADVVIGKNSDRFDMKRINTDRMVRQLPPYPEWMDTTDDLEKQLRRYFSFPSQSLDYISTLLGYGGKVKMEFDHWAKIQDLDLLERLGKITDKQSLVLFKKSVKQVKKDGTKAFDDMVFYNKKDVKDTESILLRVLPYIKLRHKANTNNDAKGTYCTLCNSPQVIPTKIISVGQTKYQQFNCLEHNGYAGRATFLYDKHRHKRFGRLT